MSDMGILIIMGIVAAAALSRKNLAGSGFLLGFFLGPIGIAIAFILRAKFKDSDKDTEGRRSCPYCSELIKREAKMCRFCGKEIEPEKA